MARNRNIKVVLDDEQYAFLKQLAKQDGITVTEEMQNMFYLELREQMDFFDRERAQEEDDK